MLRDWNSLPECMKKEEVKKYYMDLAKKRPALFAKRFLDVVLGIILTVLLSPVMLILAVCIKLDSKGPIFYRQERITQYGRPYRIFKFRTMVADADKQGPLVTRGGDSRITNIGRKLRKCRLDEIPQLFFFLKGDMSFVGTRPEVKKYVDAYSPEMMATLLLPAGITSRTSIAYKNEEDAIDFYKMKTGKDTEEIYIQYILPEKMKYNLEYIESFSVLGDLKIMADTALAVIK